VKRPVEGVGIERGVAREKQTRPVMRVRWAVSTIIGGVLLAARPFSLAALLHGHELIIVATQLIASVNATSLTLA
jgi:hypothetical protein